MHGSMQGAHCLGLLLEINFENGRGNNFQSNLYRTILVQSPIVGVTIAELIHHTSACTGMILLTLR